MLDSRKPVEALFDRISDSEEGESEGIPDGSRSPRTALIAAIARDLERLLGARPRLRRPPHATPRCAPLDYGLSARRGLAESDLAGPSALEEAAEHAISAYEPRLADVAVRVVVPEEPSPFAALAITARLAHEPAFSTVRFLASGEARPRVRPMDDADGH